MNFDDIYLASEQWRQGRFGQEVQLIKQFKRHAIQALESWAALNDIECIVDEELPTIILVRKEDHQLQLQEALNEATSTLKILGLSSTDFREKVQALDKPAMECLGEAVLDWMTPAVEVLEQYESIDWDCDVPGSAIEYMSQVQSWQLSDINRKIERVKEELARERSKDIALSDRGVRLKESIDQLTKLKKEQSIPEDAYKDSLEYDDYEGENFGVDFEDDEEHVVAEDEMALKAEEQDPAKPFPTGQRSVAGVDTLTVPADVQSSSSTPALVSSIAWSTAPPYSFARDCQTPSNTMGGARLSAGTSSIPLKGATTTLVDQEHADEPGDLDSMNRAQMTQRESSELSASGSNGNDVGDSAQEITAGLSQANLSGSSPGNQLKESGATEHEETR